MDKIQEQLFLPMDWESARPELVRKQFELARSVNRGADGFLVNYRTLSAATTLNAADGMVLCDASAGTFTINLLESNEIAGKVIYFKKTTAANLVIVKAEATNSIEGAAAFTLSAQYDSLRLLATGATTLWRV